ncbi:MAG: UDP-N-acetylmuramoyl-L-alanine--D-glutamate ligase [Pseudomonadota bacterium]|nr:UDP-N-acetylmuramoyl-L-alanine--D-glutamate ligase [Pseudomonadota bacterium]
MIPVLGYQGASVGILGLGRTGRVTAKALELGGANTVCWDDSQQARDNALKEGLTVSNLNLEEILSKITTLIVSPGIPHLYPAPHPIIACAMAKGIILDNDVGLFFRSFGVEEWSNYEKLPKVICITGSNGKSTTTALLGHILSDNGYSVEMGGNIGNPVLNLKPGKEGDIKIIEISSYQAELARTLHPDIAVLTNVTSDHIDRHSGIGGYFAAKCRLFTMGSPEKCIIGVDENEGLYLANLMRNELISADPVITFSSSKSTMVSEWSFFIKKRFLIENRGGRQISSIDLRKIENLHGSHNYQNFSAAYACCRALALSPRKIEKSTKSFSGLKHRTQILGKRNGVLFVNDSKATNVSSASYSLKSFKNIRWIVGGVQKDGGLEGLFPMNPNVKAIYLIGQSQDFFSNQLGDQKHYKCTELGKAVERAFSDAEPGDTILLAPACSSFDQFESFEERGNRFIELFAKL